jgi:hypothetical protein
MLRKDLEHILVKHVPAGAVSYCLALWDRSSFEFTLSKVRQSKVGDFICRSGNTPEITINSDLHAYLFLITYVHEVAHLQAYRINQRAEPHGQTWKDAFARLIQPVLTIEVFPERLLNQLIKHIENPKASTFSDTRLTQLLREHDPKWRSATQLSEIPEGSLFGLRGKWFRKGALRRTRFLCMEVRTRRKFLVPADHPVENAQLSLL